MLTAAAAVLLIGQDADLYSALSSALVSPEGEAQISRFATFGAARRMIAEISPEVIVLEQSVLAQPPGARLPPLSDVVALLAGFAPVVILGEQQAPAGLRSLIAAGIVDYLPGGVTDFAGVADCVQSRLRASRLKRLNPGAKFEPATAQQESFGDILRHELNNPLTGILGNAELLLAETRRENCGPCSPAGLQRLETIAALAVRMRETVRRLSQACDSREAVPRL
jgi:signal transduction histidine kinase